MIDFLKKHFIETHKIEFFIIGLVIGFFVTTLFKHCSL